MTQDRTVGDLGEAELLRLIAERVPAHIGGSLIGDDAAVVPATDGPLLVATDMIVEAVDFDLEFSSPQDVAWKAIAINVSDIAAMGGRPTAVVATLSMPSTTGMDFFEGFLEGLVAACDQMDCKLVGGDLSEGSEISSSVTVIGTSDTRPVMRSGASVGERICVTGAFGASAAGLEALRAGLDRSAPGIAEVVERHLRPVPRVEAGVALAAAGATAMIDVSDGLGLDLLRLLEASGVGCEAEQEVIPVASGVAEVARLTDLDPARAALGGGEDQELICTLPPGVEELAARACAEIGVPLTVVGEVTDGAPLLGGEDLRTKEDIGWQHLKRR